LKFIDNYQEWSLGASIDRLFSMFCSVI